MSSISAWPKGSFALPIIAFKGLLPPTRIAEETAVMMPNGAQAKMMCSSQWVL